MSPAIDNPERDHKWPYFLYGGAGCLALVVLCVLAAWIVLPRALAYWMGSALSSSRAGMVSPPPIVHKSPYVYSYSSNAMTCPVVLPDKRGSITYMHSKGLRDPILEKMPCWDDERAVRLTANAGAAVDLPIPGCNPDTMRVGVYWYRKCRGRGPCVRLCDKSGQESLIDVGRKMSVAVLRVGKSVYGGDFLDNHEYDRWDYEILAGTDDKPLKVGSVEFDGKPAYDITPIIGKDKGKYLGSIVRAGNKLTFVRATKAGNNLPASRTVRH